MPTKDITPVTIEGATVGTVHRINTARKGEPAKIRYYGQNAAKTASGDAHDTPAEAAEDVIAWHDGKTPLYTKHGLKNMENRPTVADQLLAWLQAEKKTIKAGGIAEDAGVDVGTVSRWMQGKTTPNETTIEKLAATAKRYGFKAKH